MIGNQRILLLNCFVNTIVGHKSSIFGDLAFDHFTHIFVDPNGILSSIHQVVVGARSPNKSRDLELGNRLTDQLFRRLDELQSAVDKGAVVIRFSRPIQAQTLEHISEDFATRRLPTLGLSLPKKREVLVAEYTGPEEGRVFAKRILEHIDRFDTELLEDSITPAFVSRALVGDSEVVVGGYKLGEKQGGVFFYPTGSGFNDLDSYDADELISSMKDLSDKIIELQNNQSEAQPNWTGMYLTRSEASALEDSESIYQKIDDLKLKYDQSVISAKAESWSKYLFTATGNSFEDSVLRVLTELGYRTDFGPQGHADIIAVDSNTILAIEAKGLERGSRTAHVRQARQWKEQVLMAQEVSPDVRDVIIGKYVPILVGLDIPVNKNDDDLFKPRPTKAVLIQNTFRNVPLMERYPENPSEPSFPDDARIVLTGLGGVALTGIQLLGMYLDHRDNGRPANEIRMLLNQATGILQEYADWSDFLLANT